jgi:UDP-N-acetylmuramate dehydrogenase
MFTPQKKYPLASLTTFRIGGEAEYFAEVKDKKNLTQAFNWAKEKNIPPIIIGGGSNLLVNDQGVRGLVVKLSNDFYQIEPPNIICGAGLSLPQLVQLAQENSLSGLEWAVGIPGTVGGAVFGNAGAYGGQMSDIVSWVEVYDKQNNDFKKLSKNECQFSYRDSLFSHRPQFIIWAVKLSLKKDKVEKIAEKIKNITKKRAQSTPAKPSAGCVFKNIDAQYLKANNPALYSEAKEKDLIKDNLVPAGWLIDKAGLRGKQIGQAQISTKHANFIVNLGDATSEEVIMLISFVKQQVRTRFNIQLQEEIQYLGF